MTSGTDATENDLVALPGGRWRVWPEIVLRSAGFPVGPVAELANEELAEVVDRMPASSADLSRELARLDSEFESAYAKLTKTVDEWALDPRFREALQWQNPEFASRIGRAGDHRGRNHKARNRETTIVKYVQRYTTKNETIGFFGPVGWASWSLDESGVLAVPGPGLLRNRRVYFECWAIDAIGRALAVRDGVRPGLSPRRVPAYLYLDDHAVRPTGQRVPLTARESWILRLCDGVRTVREVGADLAESPFECSERQLLDLLTDLRDRGLVRLDFGGPIEAYPERRLRDRLMRIPDDGARREALADLDGLLGARERVLAAGDAVQLGAAIAAVHDDYRRLVGPSTVRQAGRTVIYEDTARDVDVRLGADLLAALGGPLSLVLDSGRWLAARIGSAYLERIGQLYERKRDLTGCRWVPLAGVLALATRDFYAGNGTPALARPAVAELQRRWATILEVPPGTRRHEVTAADVASQVRACFNSDAPPWVGGRIHSPDVMIAARSTDAINAGDFEFVLGELHLGFNTVESRVYTEQRPDPERLMSMMGNSVSNHRIMLVAPREWRVVTPRSNPPSALLFSDYTYWALGDDDVSDLPAEVIPAGALEVGPGAGGLVVRCRRSGREFPPAEVIGDYLSGVTVNAFRVMPEREHTPRVTIDRLVVSRERWRLPVSACTWAHETDERSRYLRMRSWVAEHGFPSRVFCSVATEAKPVYVDFTSIPLTNILSGMIRRLGRTDPDGEVVLTEMYPDIGQTWLVDAAGHSYTSELRLVAVDPDA